MKTLPRYAAGNCAAGVEAHAERGDVRRRALAAGATNSLHGRFAAEFRIGDVALVAVREAEVLARLR